VFREEWARTLRPPWTVPLAVAGNAALMVMAWFLLPRSWLFHYTNTVAFPLALSGWMYSDPSATNMLGSDAERATIALADRATLGKLLRAKCLVLWLLVAPVCTVLTLFIDFGEHRWLYAVATVAAVAVVPLGSLAVCCWLGVRFPYRRRSLRWRWVHRSRAGTLRWLTLCWVPYAVVPGVTTLLMLPTITLWTATAPGHNPFHATVGWFVVGVVLAAVISALCWRWAYPIAVAWAMHRRTALVRYLTDPHAG
jgi:hypothetical protein